MSTQSVSISFNGCQRNIPFDMIPAIDEPIHSVLSELHRQAPPPPLMITLSERVLHLSEIMNRLAYANTHKVRSFFFSIFPTALMAGLAAAAIFGFIFHPIIGMGITLLSLTYLLMCHIKASSIAKKDHREAKKCLGIYPFGVLLSPLFLSYLLLTRSSALQSMSNACKSEIQSAASETFSYWSSNSQCLEERIAAEEKRTEKSLLAIQKQPIRSIQGERELTAYRNLLSRTKIEISKAQAILKNKENR